MNDLAKIQNTSRALSRFYALLLVLTPIGLAWYWATLNSSRLGLPRVIAQLELEFSQPFSTSTLLLGFAASLLPAAVIMFALAQLRQLFQLYAAGTIFSAQNCIHMRNISLALLAWTPIRMVYDALISIALSIDNPAGERFVSVGIQGSELTTLLLGMVFLIITWVMLEACKLQEDNAGIV